MYEIDRELDVPLYIQIRSTIEKYIESGALKPGDKLPSVCSLAKEIGVTQATIRRALQDLSEAGHTECHVGRGTFIRDRHAPAGFDSCETREHETGHVPDRSMGLRSMPGKPREHAAKRLRSGVSRALSDIMPLAHKSGIIALTRGVPDESLLPENLLDQVCGQLLEEGAARYSAASDPQGMYELREEIAARATEQGRIVTPDMVMITNGVSQAIAIIAQSVIETQPEVLCETPCFQGIPNSFSAMGHWVETIQRDAKGPLPDQLERFGASIPRLFYLCPYVHNPMGTDLSPERYEMLVSWAKKTGTVVIADEIFRELKFSGTTQPSLIKDLGGEQAIVVSSLSKSLMTGLRIGWIISSPRRIAELVQLKRVMDHSTPAITQAIALKILSSGRFDHHVEQMKSLYAERMRTLLLSLDKYMPKGVNWSKPEGGFSILLELPQGYSSVALLLNAIDKGVSFLPGPLFDIDQRYVNGLRVSTAWGDEYQIREGVELLAAAIEEFISTPARDTGLSGLGGFH